VSRSDLLRIQDILERADLVGAIVSEGKAAFFTEDKNFSAVERHIEVIGECAAQLSQTTKDLYATVPWSEIIGMRNRLAHHYFRINEDNVWGTASRDVPALASALRENLAL